MNFRQMTDEQIAIILHGLRAVYVEESEDCRNNLIEKCEAALATRGKSLAA